MSRLFRFGLILIVCLGFLQAAPARAQESASSCINDTLESGAKILVCVPDSPNWNGDLVVYAHGYVPPGAPVEIPTPQMYVDGAYVPDLVTGLGYAFATTSYSANGLVIVPAIQDLIELVDYFKEAYPTVNRIYLVGVSEGGLVTALAIEQHSDVFTGGLEACGPIGDFGRQINYFGDFRVLFDYFFPDVLPVSPVEIPIELMAGWDTIYTPLVLSKIAAQPLKTAQLMTTSRAAFDPSKPNTIGETTIGVLWYNVFATNNAKEILGGQPFDNHDRIYNGSFNDFLLNRRVQRFTAAPAALAAINQFYRTSGDLDVPLIGLHTIGDPIVPYWHTQLYRQKTFAQHSALKYLNVTIFRYGHCSFTAKELLASFSLLVLRSTGIPLRDIAPAIPDTYSMVYLPMAIR
jgi:pimeloyl-ACP methyl ester carboxylesterase